VSGLPACSIARSWALRSTLLAALGSLGVALPASAAGGGAEIAWQAVNLALLLGVLVYFARKPALDFFRDRRSRIKGDLDEAAALLQAAEDRYAEWQRKLIDLEQETETIKNEGRRRAEIDAEAILAAAQAAAERIHRNAQAAIDQELRLAQAQLRGEAARLAPEMAARILEEQLADPDRDRLMNEFIARVEPAGRG
jgi:F-type H+-transporting ATPase subunit b